jgi:hypothetical protein
LVVVVGLPEFNLVDIKLRKVDCGLVEQMAVPQQRVVFVWDVVRGQRCELGEQSQSNRQRLKRLTVPSLDLQLKLEELKFSVLVRMKL